MLTIENGVLVKCDENATEVVIPADVKQIKKNAFESCKALKTLRFPKDFDFEYLYDNLNPYEMRDENELYYGKIDTFLIDSLTDVYYEGSIADWIKATGYLFFKENVKIHCSDGDAAPITPNMEKIVIPNGVTEIPDYAFFGYSCKEIAIPDSVTDIGRFALCNTFNLKTITLPASLNDIGENAFQESGIETINFKDTKEQWEKVRKEQPWGTYCGHPCMDFEITVHCSDGDIQINNGGKELDEKLLDAINENNFEEVVKLITAGANVNAADEFGYTALMYAAEFHEKEIAKLLVEQGADVNAVNKQGTSVYEIFIHLYGKNSGIVEFLVQHGAKTNVHNLFIEAIKNNNKDEVLKFINNGANLNHIFYIPSEYTPLSMAAKYDSKEVAELLIEHGAEVNPEPLEYYFPLNAAAEWNAKNVAEVLINHGARLYADDSLDSDDYYILEYLRPWDYAIINNSKDVIEVFLNHGYACDKVGIYDEVEDNFKNSIAYAEEHNFTELAELLKKHLKKSEN